MPRFVRRLPLALLAAVAGCEPCFGVVQCEVDPRVAVEGQLMVHWDGAPVAGVEIELVRTGGVGLAADTLRTTTDVEGRYRLAAAADDVGPVEVAIRVNPPYRAGYRVEGIRLEATRARGEGDILPFWVVDPYFPYAGEIFSRSTGRPLAGATVEFRRTGGAQLSGPYFVNGVYKTETDGAGRFRMLEAVYPSVPGSVTGELTVRAVGSGATFVIRDILLESTHVAYHPQRIARWGVGSSLNYVGELRYRSGRALAAGVQIEVRRVGGISATPASFITTTGENGRFPFHFTSSGDGEVIADLHLTPPAPYTPEVIRGVRIPTFQSDEIRLLGSWGVGFSLNYVGELWWASSFERAEGVEVEFRRTGGISVQPETFVVKSDEFGRFPLAPHPLAAGEVEFELEVRPPSPARPFTITNLRMATTLADHAAVLGVWLVPQQ